MLRLVVVAITYPSLKNYLPKGIENSTSSGGRHFTLLQTINSSLPVTALAFGDFNFIFWLNTTSFSK
jgi:hypothetical protein